MAGEIVIERANRDKASSRVVRLVVVAFLLVSALLVTVVTIGGWDVLAGAQVLQIAYVVLYLVMAFGRSSFPRSEPPGPATTRDRSTLPAARPGGGIW